MKQKSLKHYILLPYYVLQLAVTIALLILCGNDEDDEEKDYEEEKR